MIHKQKKRLARKGSRRVIIGLLSMCGIVTLSMLHGCRSMYCKPALGDDVTVLVFLNGYTMSRADKAPYSTFVDVGIRIDGTQATEMYQVVECAGGGECGPSFVGVESYQLFLNDGKPTVLVELLTDDVAVVSKVTQVKKIPGGYYLVKEHRGDVLRRTFKSKRYADFFREAMRSQLLGNGHEILRRSFVNTNAIQVWERGVNRKIDVVDESSVVK